MQKRSFGLGLALGAVIAATIALGFAGGPGDRVTSGERVDSAGPDGRSGPAPRLEAELTALRAENARLRESTPRREVSAPPATPPAPAPAVDPEPAVDEDVFLLRELADLMRTGGLERRFRGDTSSLRLFLLETWMMLDEPERALAIIRNSHEDPMAASFARAVADQLWERGQPELAAEAAQLAVRDSPEDYFLLAEFGQRSPEAALAFLDELAAAGTVADVRVQRAIVLLQAGRRDEALSLFDGVAAAGEVPPMAWEQLLLAAPEAAAERLRQRLATGANDPDVRFRLARALHASGDDDAARTELYTLLESQPSNGDVLQMLQDIDPNGALVWIERRMAQGDGEQLWGTYARSLELGGRTQEALGAYWRAIEVEPSWDWYSRILAIDPLGSAARLTTTAEAERNDELLGDIADALWANQRNADAARLWRRALELDPTDSEWINKVRAVDAGHDPLH